MSSLGLNPSRTYKQRPDKFNMQYKEHKVNTSDGAELNVWDFPGSSKSSELVLICHNGEGNMADYLRRIDQFKRLGYRTVIFDYRGYGESSEFVIDNKMYIYSNFQDDLKAMMDYCAEQATTFGIYGWGIGGGLALGMGFKRNDVKQIIADTPFLSMEDLEDRFEKWEDPLSVPVDDFDKKLEPINALDGKAGKAIEKILLIVGSNDELIDLKAIESLGSMQKKLIGKDNIKVVENPDRKDNFKVNKAQYFRWIKEFLQD